MLALRTQTVVPTRVDWAGMLIGIAICGFTYQVTTPLILRCYSSSAHQLCLDALRHGSSKGDGRQGNHGSLCAGTSPLSSEGHQLIPDYHVLDRVCDDQRLSIFPSDTKCAVSFWDCDHHIICSVHRCESLPRFRRQTMSSMSLICRYRREIPHKRGNRMLS